MSLLYAALADGGGRIGIDEYDPASHRGRMLCPVCDAGLTARRGSVKVHHYAHKPGARCDPWRQGMTEWHRSWQEHWDPERNEVRMERGGIVHIADVVTTDCVVVEFQHSDLSREEVAAREAFYGDMVWVFDGGDSAASRVLMRGRNFVVYTLPHFGWAWTRKPALLDTPWGLFRLTHQRLSNPRVVLGKLTSLEEAGVVPDRMRIPFHTAGARVPPTHPDMALRTAPTLHITQKSVHDQELFARVDDRRVAPALFALVEKEPVCGFWLDKEESADDDYNWHAYNASREAPTLRAAWHRAQLWRLPLGPLPLPLEERRAAGIRSLAGEIVKNVILSAHAHRDAHIAAQQAAHAAQQAAHAAQQAAHAAQRVVVHQVVKDAITAVVGRAAAKHEAEASKLAAMRRAEAVELVARHEAEASRLAFKLRGQDIELEAKCAVKYKGAVDSLVAWYAAEAAVRKTGSARLKGWYVAEAAKRKGEIAESEAGHKEEGALRAARCKTMADYLAAEAALARAKANLHSPIAN